MNKNFVEYIFLDDYSKTPKYKQIINCILAAIGSQKLNIGDKLPSVNKLLIEFDISRDTIVKAYDYLKSNQIIESVPGKGYYVKENQISDRPKILLLFNKLSAPKKIIYDAFSSTLGEDAMIDFYIYHNDFNLFKKLLHNKLEEDYTHFVIISHFLEGGDNALQLVNQIPVSKLILLDKEMPGITGEYASVYQDFENDIYHALIQILPQLAPYKKLKLIFPDYTYHPISIKEGFRKFCVEYAFAHSVIGNISAEKIEEGDVYVNLMEDDLIQLIKRCKSMNFKVGEHIGIISYNETPLKEILLEGITTFSTDFALLGKTAAEFIRKDLKEHIPNPFYVKLRNSL